MITAQLHSLGWRIANDGLATEQITKAAQTLSTRTVVPRLRTAPLATETPAEVRYDQSPR
jgi:hypothetical protein